MESVSWSPPVPSGEAAIAAWRNLDRRTRRELLRAAGSHPDPFVAGVAVGYARTKLQSRMPSTSRPAVFNLVFKLVFAGSVLLLEDYSSAMMGLGGGYRDLAYVPAVVLVLTALVLVCVGRRFRLGLIRMESVNAPMLAEQTALPVPPAVAGTPLSVTCDLRVTVLLRGLLFPSACIWLVFTGANETRLAVSLNILAVFWAVYAYAGLVMLPGRQVLVVDGQGVRFDGKTVPWAAVTEVHIHRERWSGFSAARPVISFVCVDPEAVIAQMRGRRRRRNARSFLRWYGSPFVFIMVRGLDRTVEEVIASVTSFRPVPVRRFDIWGR